MDNFETMLFLPKGEGRKGEGGLRTKGSVKKPIESKPFITIITVTFNADQYLEKTIESAINQNYDNVEYIIVDGGSNDDTLKIIEKYEDHIDYWVSETDNGIYDAMNKGIDLARGNGLLFLNAGDHFVGNVISDKIVVPCFLNVKYHNTFGRLVNIKSKSYKLGLPTCHQGIVFENKRIKYNLDYKISSDYEFYLRHGYGQLPNIKTEGYVYYDNEGYSKINLQERDKEIGKIIDNNFGFLYALYFRIIVKFKSVIRRIYAISK